MSAPHPGAAPAAFDALAGRYDDTFTHTAVGRALRELVWLRLDDRFRDGARVLDLGCGTGEDAVHLACRGSRVVAVDASAAMIGAARLKARAAGCADRVEFHCAAMEDFIADSAAESFDGVLSNFGAVNCVRDLPRLVAAVARGLRPGGRLLWVIMGRHVPWEWAWFLLHGRWQEAWRRLGRNGARWRGLTISYPTAAEVARLLGPKFTLERVSPLGIALPPGYAAAWLDRSPRALALLVRAERRAQAWSALARWSDHYLLEATRRAEPG